MKTSSVLLLLGGMYLFSRRSVTPLTTQQSNAQALNSPIAQDAYENIGNTYGDDFARQVETAVTTASNAAEAFAMLGYGIPKAPTGVDPMGNGMYDNSAILARYQDWIKGGSQVSAWTDANQRLYDSYVGKSNAADPNRAYHYKLMAWVYDQMYN